MHVGNDASSPLLSGTNQIALRLRPLNVIVDVGWASGLSSVPGKSFPAPCAVPLARPPMTKRFRERRYPLPEKPLLSYSWCR
jgi:hypothetical protein